MRGLHCTKRLSSSKWNLSPNHSTLYFLTQWVLKTSIPSHSWNWPYTIASCLYAMSFWPKTFATNVYLINCMPKENLGFTSSYQKLFGTLSNFDKLCMFSCLCYPWLKPYTTHKLESWSKSCVFLGYSLSQTAYLYLESSTNKIIVSRHVIFVESVDVEKCKHPSGMFSCCAHLDQPVITMATGSYPDGTCSDAKVGKDFRRWKR